MVHSLRRSLVAMLVLACSAATARAQSRSLDDYAVFATDQLRSKGMTVKAGDVGVNLGSLFAGGAVTAPSSTVVADTTRLAPGSTCSGLFTGLLLGPACGPQTPFTGPIIEDVASACEFPTPFPACGASSVTIAGGQTRTLGAGAYGNLVVMGGASGGTLVLKGGTYEFCSIRLSRGARMVLDSASQVFVSGDVRLSTHAQETPAAGAPITPADIRLFVNGGKVRASRLAVLDGRVCDPAGSIGVTRGALVDGQLVGRRIRLDGATVQHTGFVPTPTTTSTTTTTTSTLPCSALCGNGVIDAACHEDCDTGSAGGGFVSAECPICQACRCVTTSTTVTTTTTSTSIPGDCPQRCGNGVVDAICGEQCDIGSAESSFVSPECPSCQACRCVTTTSTVVTTTTSTSIPGDCPQRCGNGMVDTVCGEQCDGSARGAFEPCEVCTSDCKCASGTTTTTLPTVSEICGNCRDDDGNGAIDFEDPACCSQAQTFSMELKHGRFRPHGTASRVRLRAFLARAGMDDIDPSTEDVQIQLRTSEGEALCATIPAGKFKHRKQTFKFRDKKHTVPTAFAFDRVTIRVRKNHTVVFRAAGKNVTLATPSAGSLRLTVGFRNPATAEATNRCSTVRSAEFRTGPKGSIRFP
jgi:hypothetical protein